jgi:hypothetical protein
MTTSNLTKYYALAKGTRNQTGMSLEWHIKLLELNTTQIRLINRSHNNIYILGVLTPYWH